MAKIDERLAPIHPGEMLEEEFLKPMGISHGELAGGIGVSEQEIDDFTHGVRDLTADLAIRLGRFFDLSPDYWLNLQIHYQKDCLAIAEEQRAKKGDFDFIKAFKPRIAML